MWFILKYFDFQFSMTLKFSILAKFIVAKFINFFESDMTEKQRTIKDSVSFSGVGIHTGDTTTITFHPAPENYGYRFIRTDLAEPVEIPALTDFVVDLSRGTTIGIGDVRVYTVEHVLAALAGLQVITAGLKLKAKSLPLVTAVPRIMLKHCSRLVLLSRMQIENTLKLMKQSDI